MFVAVRPLTHMSGRQPQGLQGGTALRPTGAKARQLDASKNLQANEADTVRINVPFSGFVTQAFLGFPKGSNEKAGVQIRNQNDQKILPFNDRSNYIALDNIRRPFPTNFAATSGGKIRVEFNNTDNNPHFITVILTIISDEQLDISASDRLGSE